MARAKKNNITTWLMIGGAAYIVWNYVRFSDDGTMKLTDIGFNGSYIDATFLVNNPTDLSGTIDNITGSLKYKGTKFASVNTNVSAIVPAGLPFSIKVKMLPDYGNVFSSVIQLLTNKNFNKEDVRFVGKLIFSGVGITVNTALL